MSQLGQTSWMFSDTTQSSADFIACMPSIYVASLQGRRKKTPFSAMNSSLVDWLDQVEKMTLRASAVCRSSPSEVRPPSGRKLDPHSHEFTIVVL